MSRLEKAISAFEQWESRLRGTELFAAPIDIEPPFSKLNLSPDEFIDDGKWKLFQKKRDNEIQVPRIAPSESEVVDPCGYRLYADPLRETSSEYWELFILEIASFPTTFSFEFHGTKDSFWIQLVFDRKFEQYVLEFLFDSNPHIKVEEVHTDLHLNDLPFAIADFGLSKPVFEPVEARTDQIDPLFSLLSLFNNLGDSEYMMVQLMFRANKHEWEAELFRLLHKEDGSSLLGDEASLQDFYSKTESPLLSARIRGCVWAQPSKILESSHRLVHALQTVFQGDALEVLSNEGFSLEDHLIATETRQGYRSGFLISLNELLTLVHIPDPHGGLEILEQLAPHTELPAELQTGNVSIGQTAAGERIFLQNENRLRHMHVLGGTGSGKTTFLENLIIQDIQNGTGVTVFDPHGDLVEGILNTIPEKRIHDVVVFDPSDQSCPPGINIFQASSEAEKILLTSDLISAFKEQSTSWGDQMNAVLQFSIETLVESPVEATIFDLIKLLQDKAYRSELIETITDPHLKHYWQVDFARVNPRSLGPLITRLKSFLSSKLIRNMMVFPDGIDLSEVLDSEKILLIKLSHGLIGAENASLLGRLLITKLYQAALGRQQNSYRPKHFVYIDEFHHFITPTLSDIITGVRKYGIGLVLAHQNLDQLKKSGNDLSNVILGNVDSSVAFSMGHQDSKRMAQNYGCSEDLFSELKQGNAIAKIGRSHSPLSIFADHLKPLTQVGLAETIRESSQKNYCHTQENANERVRQYYSKTDIEFVPKIKKTAVEKTEVVPQEMSKPSDSFEAQKAEFHQKEIEKRGIKVHRKIQLECKALAQGFGWKATIESRLGAGVVDIYLQREGQNVAVEVSVTNTIPYEIGNIQKSLDAKCDQVIFMSEDKDKRDRIEKEFTNVNVTVIHPLEFKTWLLENQKDFKSTVRGYKVNTRYTGDS